jgi:hypothetical protein
MTPPAPLEAMRVASDRRLVQMLLVTMLFPTGYFAAVDLLGVRPGETSFESRVLARGVSLAVPLVGLWLLQRARTRQEMSRVVFSLALVAVPVLMILLWQRPSGASLPWPPMLLILIVLYGALPNTMARQMLPPLALSAYLAVARVGWLNGGDSAVSADLLVLVFVNVVGILMVRRRVLHQEMISEAWLQADEALARAERATHDLKTLRGIIPICAACKQVRVGKNEWQQIERYVRENSDAQFSHGMCPDCAKTLYPEFMPDPRA